MPEVSIILPVYNEERHLQKTLSTLCTQTFRDFELLAVDDGSTDESRRILERFAAADARITVLAQHHGGVSRARNLALEAATGKWVWFVDSDDLPFLNFLEKATHPLSPRWRQATTVRCTTSTPMWRRRALRRSSARASSF